MVWVYFDASVLVKRYSSEDGTELVNELFYHLPIERMTCAVIGVFEIISVLVRKRNDGRLSPKLFAQAMLELNKEVIEDAAFSIASVNDELILSALNLIAQHNINATDAVILRSCLNLQQILLKQDHRLVFWSCDKRLLRAARHEGVEVFDPEVGTKAQLQALVKDS
ncbi:MAG: type II toxin-antitoxin system VapC family toxin [Chloroflexi bacterium]|nr:type II toxin-antitoxin system VapC family toxin [Chloroflexota bacterium]